VALELLDTARAVEFSQTDLMAGEYSEAELDILREVNYRKASIWSEQSIFQSQCDRFDALYYPEDVLQNGASHWAWHSSAKLPGKAHVSVNTPPIYVDLPASLQSIPPIENVIPASEGEDDADIAVLGERIYFAWKDEEEYEFKGHRACVVKGLYGRTAGKVWWDPEERRVRVEVIDQPRNLWLGWSQSDLRSLDWAAYSYTVTPEEALAQWGLVTTMRTAADGNVYPYLVSSEVFGTYDNARRVMWNVGGKIEVVDYWYRAPARGAKPKVGQIKPVKHDTWNAIIVGNRVVKNMRHPEYAGRMPYVPLFNTFIPGVPSGRPELHDIEQLLREKDERISSGSQLMHNIVNAQYWQLTGQEAPDQVPVGLRPKPNQVVAPGAGNRIEKIDPWMPEFQLEQFLGRIDREKVEVSGINDLLLGLAPSTVLSSSKAINALVSNYETRIRMKRDLYYGWRRKMWNLSATVWAHFDPAIREVLNKSKRIDMVPPSLTPRDDMEASQIALNLSTGKLWSQRRAMDRVGVDDPEREQDMIREERTDATMFPAEVQVLAQLLATLRNMGFGQQPEATAMAEEAAAQMADQRALGGGMEGMPSMNGAGEQPIMPPEMLSEGAPMPGGEGMPMGAPGEPMPLAQPGSKMISQTQIVGGEARNRLLSQVPIGQPPEGV
jgi:hypothetical protein